ncbi:AAA family ATPase [Oscillatoria sp. FACHB-1406]|uniref:ATP-binding protein n=1 Tax=Oscillatoria sp. FACHB-1406 TaxID=2692846 RepID=UPI0016882776|nr:AAA family ATPase [Oscillatoria sp. FACHB-1406]MBD2576490.1 ATP-binding protein [Oscillatoria sp. FACHB-1406]
MERREAIKEIQNSTWQRENFEYLELAIIEMRQRLLARAARVQGQPLPEFPDLKPHWEALQTTSSATPALEQLASTFNLSPFEKDVLILCLGMEWDVDWGTLCASAGMLQLAYPTWDLAFNLSSQPDWQAFSPEAPLRQWNFIELKGGHTLIHSPLRINEWTLHYLRGTSSLDEELIPLVAPVEPVQLGAESHRQLASQVVALWGQRERRLPFPIVQLCGQDRSSNREIASSACEQLGLKLYALSGAALLANPSNLPQIVKLWEREARSKQLALLLDADEFVASEMGKANPLALFPSQLSTPIFVIARERAVSSHRPTITFDVSKPTPGEQVALWNQALGEQAFALNGFVETLVSQFDLAPPTIQAASASLLGSLDATSSAGELSVSDRLWDTCRRQARPQLDELAQSIATVATWEDLVLPEMQRQTLEEIVAHVRQRARVYERWGFRSKSQRGLGISALFAGASGTGKTMAAEVIAGALQLDLYRIDLSAVVSKYIGETEKNLRRVFDAAEMGGVVLLFDEADALFSKRSDVKDSNDRYANMEVSYLLQRMEAYRGLAILTTNLKDSIDFAFLRRLRFIVKFAFPDNSQRRQIWERIFPKDLPTENLNYQRLAKLNVAGGNIRNIALNAAFLAAQEGGAVTMERLLRATQSEYVKLERPLTDAEIRGWVELPTSVTEGSQ